MSEYAQRPRPSMQLYLLTVVANGERSNAYSMGVSAENAFARYLERLRGRKENAESVELVHGEFANPGRAVAGDKQPSDDTSEVVDASPIYAIRYRHNGDVFETTSRGNTGENAFARFLDVLIARDQFNGEYTFISARPIKAVFNQPWRARNILEE